MSILALTDGTFDISNNKFNVYESNVVLTQNYGINGGITEISSNMFNIINSNVNISRNNPYLGLNNIWTGKNLFNGDISFININTLINSLNTINLSSSAINISGGPVNIGAAKLASLDVSGNAAFNNSSTQISSKSLIGLSGGVVNISGGAVNINGGILNISGGQLNIGSALYMSNSSPVYLTNANTFGAGMMDLSRAYLGYGTASNNAKFICDNIGNTAVDGSGAFFVSSMNGAVISNNGLAVGKSTRSTGYALDVSGSVIINNGNVGIGITAPAYTLDVSGVISASNKNGNSGNGVQTFITSGNGSFGSIECTNSANTVKLPLCLQGYGGNVGIGTTNPLNNLDVSGTIKASSTIYSNNLLIQGDGTNAYIRPTNTNNSSLYLGSNDNNIMAINSAGNVGIGTMAPVLGSLLHLYKSGANYTTLRMENSNNMLDIGTQNTGETFMTSINNYSMLFSTNNTERMRIDQTGKIGVGTTIPVGKIHVVSQLSSSTPDFGNWTNTTGWGLTLTNGSGSSSSFPALMFGMASGTNPTTYITSLYPNVNWNPLMIDGQKICLNSNSGGYLGIGTSSPNYPLHVYGSEPYTAPTYTTTKYFDGGSTNIQTQLTTGYSYSYSIYASAGIVCQGKFSATSDTRIKTNIVDIDDAKALQTLRLIKPKTYEYVDKLQRGNENVIGFIAQEIKEIIPKAVSLIKDYVPTFYTVCQVSTTDASNIVLVTSPIDLSWNPLHDQSGNAFMDANGNACSDSSGNKVFNVKLYDQSNNEIKCKTTDVLDKRSFLMDVTGSTLLDASGNLTLEADGGYFLHGQEIDDFHTLDKNAIFTVVTAAVQDIDRIVQADKSKIQELENKVAMLEQQNAEQKEQIAAILARLGM